VDGVSLQTGLPAPTTLYSAHETLRGFDAALPEVRASWRPQGRAAWAQGHPAVLAVGICFSHPPAPALTPSLQDGGDGALLLLPHA